MGSAGAGVDTQEAPLSYKIGTFGAIGGRAAGGDRGNRTPNLGIANAALSLLSYIPTTRGTTLERRTMRRL